jgi:hypothetical protein
MGDFAQGRKTKIRSVISNAAEAIKRMCRLSMEIRIARTNGSSGSVLGLSEFNTEDAEKSHRGHEEVIGVGEDMDHGKRKVNITVLDPSHNRPTIKPREFGFAQFGLRR